MRARRGQGGDAAEAEVGLSSTGNGADIGQVLAIVQDLAAGQRDLAAGQRQMGNTLDSLARDIRQEMAALRHELRQDMHGLRQQVTEYHSSVLGHGVLISELEQRVRRIERHLELPPAAE